MKTMELPSHVLHSSVLTDFDMNKKGKELLRLCNNKHFESSQKLRKICIVKILITTLSHLYLTFEFCQFFKESEVSWSPYPLISIM